MISFDTHSGANFPPLPILRKYILLKKHFFFKKKNEIKNVFENVFENFFYFSRILRQICYNLVIKVSNFRTVGHRAFQSAGKRKKNARPEWMIFLPYIIMGRK